jgi:predicted esterase
MMIDGPRMPPASRGKPKQLVVLLHGYGSNGEDLISLAPYWAKTLPDAQFVSPNAPDPVPGYPGGYQWFPITKLPRSRAGALWLAGGKSRIGRLQPGRDDELACGPPP